MMRKIPRMIVCHSRLSVAAVGALGAIALLGSSCGGSSPSSSTPSTTVAPQPTPTPTPAGGGSFYNSSCPLGKGDPAAE